MSSTSVDLYQGRRRLAWVVVWISFSIFLALLFSIPIVVSRFIQENTRPLMTMTFANQGTLGIVHGNGDTTALFAADIPLSLPPGNGLLTKAADSAIFSVLAPDSEDTLVRGQIYTDSSIWLDEVSTPRFQVSNRSHMVHINLEQGRLRLTTGTHERGLDVLVKVPQGVVRIQDAGEYSFDAQSASTQVSVLAGTATVAIDESEVGGLVLTSDQRAILDAGQPPTGPFTAERNLIKNGNFQTISQTGETDETGVLHWAQLDWSIDLDNEPIGETVPMLINGEQAIRFTRTGSGHAEASIRQVINQDVTDLNSLILLVGVRINEQSLDVCGSVGSECPLTVRLAYEDGSGRDHTWQQGFFIKGEIGPTSPDICNFCAPPYNPHRRIQPGRLFIEEVDLLQSLADAGQPPPSRITDISLQAAGHSFEAEIFEVSLMARE